MKKLLNIIVVVLLGSSLGLAQAPSGLNYQTVLRDNNGDLLVGQNVDIKLSILDEIATGTVLFVETHTKTSNTFGLINIKIGSVETESFSNINWTVNDKYLKVEIDF